MKMYKRKGKENKGGTKENRSVTVAPARSETLLCKLTLRVCIAGSEQEERTESGRREGRGEKEQEKEEIKRARAERSIKRGDGVNRRKGVMNGGPGSEWE